MVEQASVSVVPGETGTTSVRIRNTGTVVDQFTLTVLGQPAAWTTVVPAALSLFPNADGVIELHFAPPRAPGVGAGPTPFGVRVVGSEDPESAVVEEGEVDLLPFVDVTAKVTPRTSETKRKARHDIVLDNKGNAPITVALSATDPDEQLAFDLKEPSVTVEAGQSRHVPLKVAARKGFARGADKHRPFQVTARPEGAAYPLVVDANLIQKAGMPRFVMPLVAGLVALALIAAVLPGMLGKEGGGGIIDLANSEAPTTTAAAPAEEDPGEDPNAAATPEEAAAAAAAELAANGKDADSPTSAEGGSTDGGTTAAGGDSVVASPTTTAASNISDGGTEVTSPPATTAPPPPGGSTTTTTAATTTTTTKPTSSKFGGGWVATDGQSKMSIVVGTSMQAQTGGAIGSFTCSGSVADANDDGMFTAKCSDGTGRSFQYLSSTDQVKVSYPSGGSLCPRSGCFITFNRN